MACYSCKQISKFLVQRIIKKYSYLSIDTNQDTIYFLAKIGSLTVTIYKNNSLLLQGPQNEIDRFVHEFFLPKSNSKLESFQHELNFNEKDVIGCDEVGTGDYFGPVVTCACFVKKEKENKLKELGVKDSKLLTDSQIQSIAPLLIKHVTYECQICWPRKYNLLIEKYHNNNIIKSFFHDYGLKLLCQKIDTDRPYIVVMDQFVSPNKYREYFRNVGLYPQKIDLFITHAEQKYLAVAAASIIARDTFLKCWMQMEEKAGFDLPRGATKIDTIVQKGKIIVKEEKIPLKNVAKLHFASITNKINE